MCKEQEAEIRKLIDGCSVANFRKNVLLLLLLLLQLLFAVVPA